LFYGEYAHSLDIKNRMVIPAKFRTALGNAFMITHGFDKCLTIYTMDEWHNLEERLKILPRSNENVRKHLRTVFGEAFGCEPDGSGRVLIPQKLRDYAGINKDLISIGVSEYIEVWSKEFRDEANSAGTADDLARIMKEYGI